MYLLYCDETNLNRNENEFFIYGGLSIPGEGAQSLSAAIDQIRCDFAVPAKFLIKFNPKPDHLTHQQFIELKQRIIEAATRNKCRLLASTILHSIATSPDDARRKEINRVVFHFNCLLNRLADHGLVLIDRFSDNQIDTHLREKFAIGLRGMPYGDTMRLQHIVGFHYSAIGQAHFPSIVDIAIGSLRFAVNTHARNDQERLPTAVRLLELIAPLFLRNEISNKVEEISLFFSPKIVKSNKFRAQYQALKDFLGASGIQAQQEVSDTRTY